MYFAPSWGKAIAAVLPDGELLGGSRGRRQGRPLRLPSGLITSPPARTGADVAAFSLKNQSRFDLTGHLWVSEKLGWRGSSGPNSAWIRDWQSVEPGPLGHSATTAQAGRHSLAMGTRPRISPGVSGGAFARPHAWSVGTNTFKGTRAGPALEPRDKYFQGRLSWTTQSTFFTPVKIGPDSDWARMSTRRTECFDMEARGNKTAKPGPSTMKMKVNGLEVRDPVVE